VYASVADLRAEGVTAAEASDARLELLLAEASSLIDRVTGWFFEPRLLTLRLSGRGAPSIELPVPPIRVDRLLLGSVELSLDPSELLIVGAPIQPGFDGPRFTRRHGRVFPRGHGNVCRRGALGLHRGRRHAHGAHAASDPPRDDAPRPSLHRAARRRRLVRGTQSLAHHRGAHARPELPARPLEGFGVGEPHRRPGDRRAPCALREALASRSGVMRGRLIFPFIAELHRLDTQAMAPDYDEDFKEPVLVDSDDDGVGEPFRREHPPVRVPCQVEPEAFEALRMATSGNTPRSSFDLVFHFRDLEQLGLVDAASGDALIRPSDRLGALYARDGQLVQAVRTPPGLYVTEARPIGFGLHRRRPSRNLLLVSFQDRAAARSGT
jgi:hypothetical protein